MTERILADNVWLTALVWITIYVSDYYTTIYIARLYRAGAREHIVFEGSLELTPQFQEDIDRLRRFSSRFVARLALSIVAILTIWLLSVQLLQIGELFLLLVGGLILREAVVHIRHVRNLALYRYAQYSHSLQGRLEYSRWLILKHSAVELLAFAVFFLLLSLVVGSWLCLGGALACAVTGRQHWAMAKGFKLHAKQA